MPAPLLIARAINDEVPTEWVTSGLLVVLSLTLIMVCIGYVSTGRMRTCRTRGDRAERTAPLPPQSSPALTMMR